jgi:hypothetical protein
MSNGLYRVFTTAKRALSFQQEGVLSANTFFTFKKSEGGTGFNEQSNNIVNYYYTKAVL